MLDALLEQMILIISNHYSVPLMCEVVPFPDNSTITIEMLITGIIDLAVPSFAFSPPFHFIHQSIPHLVS